MSVLQWITLAVTFTVTSSSKALIYFDYDEADPDTFILDKPWIHQLVVKNAGQSPVLNCTQFRKDLRAKRKQLDEAAKVLEKVEQKALDVKDELLTVLPDYDYYVDPHDLVVQGLSEFERTQIKYIFDPFNLDMNVANADKNPELISGLSDCQLDHVLRWKELISRLRSSTIHTLMMDRTLAERLESTIPYATIASLIQARPQFVKNITEDFPAKKLVKKMLKTKEFLKMLPVEYIADVVESKNVRQILDRESIGVALSTHPGLPAKLGPNGLDFGSVFLANQDFVSSLPCAVYMNAAMNSSFVNRVSAAVLRAFSSNKHFWSCVPVEMVRHMMATTTLGTKLTLDDIIVAAKTMSKAKKMDPQVVNSIFKIQFPQLVSKAESSYFDWFNNAVNSKASLGFY